MRMDSEATVISVIVLIIAVIAIFYTGFGRHGTTTTTTIVMSTTAITTAPTTASSSTTIGYGSSNMTVNITQVISTFGTGWTAASNGRYYSTSFTMPNGTRLGISEYGISNFSNGGQFLTIEWIRFDSNALAREYVNGSSASMTIKPAAKGTAGNATYAFYAGDSIYHGQAASIMYAYDGQYGIYLLNKGSTFPQLYAEQMLGYQLYELNTT